MHGLAAARPRKGWQGVATPEAYIRHVLVGRTSHAQPCRTPLPNGLAGVDTMMGACSNHAHAGRAGKSGNAVRMRWNAGG